MIFNFTLFNHFLPKALNFLYLIFTHYLDKNYFFILSVPLKLILNFPALKPLTDCVNSLFLIRNFHLSKQT